METKILMEGQNVTQMALWKREIKKELKTLQELRTWELQAATRANIIAQWVFHAKKMLSRTVMQWRLASVQGFTSAGCY